MNMIDTILNNLGIISGPEDLPNTDLNAEMDNYSSSSSLSTSESVFSDSMHQHNSTLDDSLNVDHSSISFESQIDDLSSNDNFEAQDVLKSQIIENADDNLDKNFSSQEAELVAMLPSSTNEATIHQFDMMADVSPSPIDIDNIVNVPTTDQLEVSNEDIETLQERVEGIGREEHKGEISFGKKMCPTRHGCQGATDCDYCGGDYPG